MVVSWGLYNKDCKKNYSLCKTEVDTDCVSLESQGGIPIDVFFEEGIAPKKVYIQDLNMNIYKPR